MVSTQKNKIHERRRVAQIVEPQPVSEGAGVKLVRTIGSRSLDHLDPFLLLDHFRSDRPADYEAGFPTHPHRGIETVTYMLVGSIRHRDSSGNSGTVRAGGVQWMTAGGGILHEEMPQPDNGKLDGLQLWINLPARLKMTQPRYQEIPASRIPEVTTEDGVRIRVIAGSIDGIEGPVAGIAAEPVYLDVSIPPGGTFYRPVEREHNAFAYVIEGEGRFGLTDEQQGERVRLSRLAVFGEGDAVEVKAEDQPVRFLLVTGKPLNEPIARYGPFVMNTREQIEQTLRDLREGTFAQETVEQ